ncbi:MAG: hypothetical protein UT24_C0009G0084 [Candidatus Woesebacteria bacterium GW2011_GWB1_39_12]|uniref:Uncharacterized protein n=2 Tax=Candidatus Woeseibacteriota TaxID=1752722 RepID=A0A0G0PKE8_9BACT|nr:MAG: hypothetical protein UT23_C0002G0084 [Candidatus Woesebacteria bacterium GW2011_GWA1_39_12]KKR00767.1 MAG: hypothetical protein UT24_C0009G0084 [Candidatus Woesebacteria bacterium GW2011_GWB1_39_12]
MRKVLILPTIFFVALSLISVQQVFSQSPEATQSSEIKEEEKGFDQAYQEYILKLQDYQKVHEEYILRRSQYLRFQSLKSRQDAQEATVKMLQARDEVVITYLTTLLARLSEGIGVHEVRKEALTLRVNEEVGWFTDHKDTVPSAGTLEDLVKDSDLAKKRWEGVEPLVYEILGTTAYGKISDFTVRSEGALTAVKNKLEIISKEDRDEYKFSNEKFEVLDRWIFETEEKIVRSKEKQVEVDNMLVLIVKQRKDVLKYFNNMIGVLGESQLFLKEANTFLKEVIREVKTAED